MAQLEFNAGQKNFSVVGYSVPFMFPISSRIPTALNTIVRYLNDIQLSTV